MVGVYSNIVNQAVEIVAVCREHTVELLCIVFPYLRPEGFLMVLASDLGSNSTPVGVKELTHPCLKQSSMAMCPMAALRCLFPKHKAHGHIAHEPSCQPGAFWYASR